MANVAAPGHLALAVVCIEMIVVLVYNPPCLALTIRYRFAPSFHLRAPPQALRSLRPPSVRSLSLNGHTTKLRNL